MPSIILSFWIQLLLLINRMHQMHIRSMKKLQEENKKIKNFAVNFYFYITLCLHLKIEIKQKK